MAEALFAKFVNLLESIQRETGLKNKRNRVDKFITELRNVKADIYPVLRLLLPHLDRERATYGIKEKSIGTAYVDILSIQGSADAEKLLHWRRPTNNNKMAGDFGDVLFSVLQGRGMSMKGPGVTISDINQKLDALNMCESSAQRKDVLAFFVTHCSPIEQKWIVRIILKELKLGITETTVFNVWHPEASEYYNSNSSLLKVAHDLDDLSKSVLSDDLKLNSPFKPMLSKSVREIAEVDRLMEVKPFWIQTKLDGERMQLHKDGDSYKWFSRNGKDYTDLYGASKYSTMAKVAQACIRTDVKTCILDGELIAYSTENGGFEEFGKLKTAANNYLSLGDTAPTHPCFVVFDVLHVNGQSLLSDPLMDRYKLLSAIIKPNPNFFEILPYTEASTLADVTNSLDEHMINHEEGIIIKDPTSPYLLNDRKGSWLKLKPEYIDHLGDDLDLLLVGGFYGTGRRGRKLSHFMCAIIDNTDPDRKYISFCKIGSGYTYAELDEISQEAMGHWVPYNPKRQPDWWFHPIESKERPDMIIAPEHSRVVTVKGSEVVRSDQYAAKLTLRFPRFVRLRPDKGPGDVMTLTELKEYVETNKGKMQSRRLDLPGPKKGPSIRRSHVAAKLDSEYKLADISGIVSDTSIFEGREFCVVPGAVKEGLTKHDLERIIIQNGGSTVQNPRFDKTDFVVADKTHSYSEPVDPEQLKKILTSGRTKRDFHADMDEDEIWRRRKQLCNDVDSQYFADTQSSVLRSLRNMNVYLDVLRKPKISSEVLLPEFSHHDQVDVIEPADNGKVTEKTEALLRSTVDDALSAIQDRNQAVKSNLPNSSYDLQITNLMRQLKEGIVQLELELEREESAGSK
ncbi:DNA ligase (ATP) [Chytridiales sp. JEL 0842]|nr:DNA ligase (ATP) [Chytridiales sp. JEL 0842]